jgi:hypothetical protein
MNDEAFVYTKPAPEMLDSVAGLRARRHFHLCLNEARVCIDSGQCVCSCGATAPAGSEDWTELEKPAQPNLPSEQEQYVQVFLHHIKGSIRIPVGSVCRPCKKCPELIYEVGKQVVSIRRYKEQPEGIAPTDTDDGCGISHFANCPKAAEFRKGRK